MRLLTCQAASQRQKGNEHHRVSEQTSPHPGHRHQTKAEDGEMVADHSPILRCLERRGTQEDKAITKNGEDTRISECRRDAALRVFRRMSAFSSGPAPTGQQSLLLLRLSCGRTTPGYDASTLHGLHLPLTSNASKVRYHFMQNHMFLYSSSQCLCAKRETL